MSWTVPFPALSFFTAHRVLPSNRCRLSVPVSAAPPVTLLGGRGVLAPTSAFLCLLSFQRAAPESFSLTGILAPGLLFPEVVQVAPEFFGESYVLVLIFLVVMPLIFCSHAYQGCEGRPYAA